MRSHNDPNGPDADSLRSWAFGSFTCGHAACRGKRRALRRVPAAREALSEVEIKVSIWGLGGRERCHDTRPGGQRVPD